MFRSGKHSTSNAHTHGRDIDFLYDHDSQFKNIMNNIVNGKTEPKPILIIISDGGPDENPRYQNVVHVAIHHFVKRDLDGLFIATNAPGRSAYNRVERRMAPLSRDLCGLVLPHDFYGNHLNNKNETIDEKLEKDNFRKAAETLAEIWSESIIDGYETVAHFTEDDGSDFKDNLIQKDSAWIDRHVTFGQYLLQISKCDDIECCRPKRSCLHKILSNGRLPPPIPLSNDGPNVRIPDDTCSSLRTEQFAPLFVNLAFKYDGKCFDQFCPSVQTKIESRTCETCNKYFSSLQYLNNHKSLHKNKKNVKSQAHPGKQLPKVRPKRIAAIRASEALAIMCYDLGMEDAEWHPITELDLEDIDIPGSKEMETFPVVSIEKSLSSSWVED